LAQGRWGISAHGAPLQVLARDGGLYVQVLLDEVAVWIRCSMLLQSTQTVTFPITTGEGAGIGRPKGASGWCPCCAVRPQGAEAACPNHK
jgi:hypothetical protein